MKYLSILFFFFSVLLASAGNNLIPNGNLNEGKDTATDWEVPNGLTVGFAAEEGRGRIVRMDTQVQRKQVLAWLKTFAENPDAPVPEAIRVSKGSFASVGAFEGVALDSALIDVKPGQNYKLTADFKGPGIPFVWIKGFMKHPRDGRLADAYQTRLAPRSNNEKEWQTFSVGFNPTARTPKVEKMKVRLYAYWPNGVYYFDNISVEEISGEEMKELVAERGIK